MIQVRSFTINRLKPELLALYIAPFRRFHTQQILHEEVVTLVLAIEFAHGMMGSRNHHEFEILVRLFQRIHYLISARRIYVVIHLAYHQHQRALQLVGVLHVAALYVTGIDRPAHPLLVPPDFIHPVVMTAAGTIGCRYQGD